MTAPIPPEQQMEEIRQLRITGGPAYPQHGWSNNAETVKRMEAKGGMTLLDYYAGQALLGLCANSAIIDGIAEGYTTTWLASHSYELAAAMIVERAKKLAPVTQPA